MLAPDWIWRTSLARAAGLIALDSNDRCHLWAFSERHRLHVKASLPMSSWHNAQSPDSFFDWINNSDEHIPSSSQHWLGHSDLTLLWAKVWQGAHRLTVLNTVLAYAKATARYMPAVLGIAFIIYRISLHGNTPPLTDWLEMGIILQNAPPSADSISLTAGPSA